MFLAVCCAGVGFVRLLQIWKYAVPRKHPNIEAEIKFKRFV